MKRNLILLFFVLLTAYSCKTRNVETITKTVVEYREVVRDSTVFIPADRATVSALLECDSLGNVYMKQIRTLQGKTSANANIVIRDNYITAECECDSVSIYLTMKDRYYSSDSSTFKTELKYVEKSLSWFQKLLQNLGIALAGIIITASVFGIFYFLRKLRIL